MSDSTGEKTEAPTDKKLKDSRKKGQVAQSQDVNKLFVTVVGFNLVLSLYDYYFIQIKTHIDLTYQYLNADLHHALPIVMKQGFLSWFKVIIPLLASVVIARVMASFCQYGFLFAPESMKFDLGKISPVKNGKNIFSKKKFVEFAGNIVKAILLVSVVYYQVKNNISQILLMPLSDINTSLEVSIVIFRAILNVTMALFLVLSIIDFILQKKIFIKSMKMTKDEVFREYKQTEGDPQVKGERKSFAHELIFGDGGGMKKKVESSDAVVVNPTHYAVALEYKPGVTPLPILRAKGVDKRADQIISYARENGIPVVRYVSLARSIFRNGREDKYIPRECLKQLAAVFLMIRQAENDLEGKLDMDLEVRDLY